MSELSQTSGEDAAQPRRLRGSTVTDPLVRDLRRQIRSGQLKPGDPVLTVRELMKAYKISYNSVRRALSELSDEGLLSLEQGRGTFVREWASVPPPPAPIYAAPPPVADDATPPLFDLTPALDTRPVGLRAFAERRGWGLALPDAEAFAARPEYAEVLAGIRRRVLESGDVLAMWSAHARKRAAGPAEALAAGAQGVLLLGPRPLAELHGWLRPELPAVLLDQLPGELPLNAVGLDHYSAGYQLARLLVQAGHRRVAYVRDASQALEPGAPALQREEGARLALREEGLELRAEAVVALPPGAPAEHAHALLSEVASAPTALLVDDEALARALLSAEAGAFKPALACTQLRGAGDGVLAGARLDYGKLGELGFDRVRQVAAGAGGSPLRVSIPVEIARGKSVRPA
ncbi:MAG: GntR family transcriptional regulator [Planctomycetes bacterium]|nr:GntR family transcriptional regulator [Planctomycetota bacterium]